MHAAKIGEKWAYRAPKSDELIAMRVVDLKDEAGRRAFIEPLGQWVPAGRLKVLWTDVDEYIAREARWTAINRVSVGRENGAYFAIDIVFDEVIPSHLASAGWGNQSSVTKIHHRAGLARFLDVDESTFAADPLAFVDGGDFVVSWPTTERILRAACGRYASKMLEVVRTWDRTRARRAIFGQTYPGGDWIAPEICIAVDADLAPAYDIVRGWVDSEASPLALEVVRLSAHVEEIAAILHEMAQRIAPDETEASSESL